MIRTTLQLLLMVVCLNAAWGKETTAQTALQQPRTVFVVGPGTVLSVRLMDLPFVDPYYAIRYRTDGGELIEVWTHGRQIVLLEGMHGMLSYSTHPERIVNFQMSGHRLEKQ